MRISGTYIRYDSKEFNTIFERLFPSLCMLASKILKNEEKGKDMAQEAFVKLWEKDNEDFSSEKALQAYLYVLVKNACISQIRKEKNINNTSLDDDFDIAEKEFLNEVLRQETYKLLYNAIATLSPQSKSVIKLSLQGFKNDDIAKKLSVTTNTVKTIKKRAYKKLREVLGDQLFVLIFVEFLKHL